MISGRDVIHFSLDDYWRSDPHSRHHLTREFLKYGNRVIWVNSFGMRIPDLRKRGNFKRIGGKLRSYLRFLRRIERRFWVFSPIAVPVLKTKAVRAINDWFLLLQIRLMMCLLRVRSPILFVTSPMFPNVIRRIRKDLVIYYYSDKYVSYREIREKAEVMELDSMTLDLADYVFCASWEIYKDVPKGNDKVFYLPHAVDFEHFNEVIESETMVAEDMKDMKRPIIGYFGSLTDSNDIELIRYLANERPEYSIVLIGEVSAEYRELSKLRNVYLLGRKSYDEVPVYGKYFDVCFMAWKMTEWIRNCSPVKTMEYLALGKPVVAGRIKELERVYGDVIAIADGREDFVDLIDENIRSDSDEKRAERMNFVRKETWEKRFHEMIEIIERRLGPRD
jgi:glycosyltransferase involved in cell wall biosynthesis